MSVTPKSIEVELKLILPAGDVEKGVIAFLRQNKYRIGKVEPLKNVDTYLDTCDWALLKNKLSLRYRLSNDQAVYTMKSTGPIANGIAKRMETEVKLDQPAHAANIIPDKSLKKQVNDIIHPRTLLEQLLICTSRRRYSVVSPKGAKFELSFDTSSFSANPLDKAGCPTQFYQLEAELLAGPDAAVKSLALLLHNQFKYPPATSSKLEQAMTHLKIEPLTKKVPENMKVQLDDRLDLALKKILAVEFHWLQEQLPGTISARDPEYVHQARVAIRRMRSVLILFHQALPDNTVTYIDERLKWLGGLFGKVRDLDVFIINLKSYKDSLEKFPKAKKRALEALIIKERRSPLKELNEALQSRRYSSFERRMIQFLESPCADNPDLASAMKPIREVAPQAVTQKFECVIKQSRKTMVDQNLSEFHCLRIQIKRLRYTLESMAPPYGNVLNDLIHQTIEIQDCLGSLQDTVFNQKLIDHILKDWRGKLVDTDLIFILGQIYQLQGEIARNRKKEFNEIWQRSYSEQTGTSIGKMLQKTSAGTAT